ncbi:MAG: hypothetical protein HOC57_07990 [Rhodospirillaceae bacterium]|nr:hypothetical protein [Rhodospirillaceae bacterium]
MGRDTYKDGANAITFGYYDTENPSWNDLFSNDKADNEDKGWFLGDDPDSLPTENYNNYNFQDSREYQNELDMYLDESVDIYGSAFLDDAPGSASPSGKTDTDPGELKGSAGYDFLNDPAVTAYVEGLYDSLNNSLGSTLGNTPGETPTSSNMGFNLAAQPGEQITYTAPTVDPAEQAAHAERATAMVMGATNDIGAAYRGAPSKSGNPANSVYGNSQTTAGSSAGKANTSGEKTNYGVEPESFIDAFTAAHNYSMDTDPAFADAYNSVASSEEQMGNNSGVGPSTGLGGNLDGAGSGADYSPADLDGYVDDADVAQSTAGPGTDVNGQSASTGGGQGPGQAGDANWNGSAFYDSSNEGGPGGYASDYDSVSGRFLGDSDGDGASDSDDSVICTELFRHHMISPEMFQADGAFGRALNPAIIRGYHFWAKPLVRLMRRHYGVLIFVKFLALPWIKEIAHRQAGIGISSFIGKIYLALGLPVCHTLGRALSAIGKRARTGVPTVR